MSLVRNSNDYRHLGGLAHLYDLYESYGMILFAILICKYSLAILVGIESFQQLKWIECYLPGGGIVSPRVPEASKYLVGISWVYFAGNKFIRRALGREFNMFCIELTCYQHQQLLSILKTGRVTEPGRPHYGCEPVIGDHPVIRDWFVSQINPMQLVRRPIRTLKLRTLTAYLHLTSLVLLVGIMFAFLCGFIAMMGPLLLTRRGFEISRKNCVRFIMEQSAASQGRYDFIYRAEPNKSIEQILMQRTIPVVLPYEELVPLNLYHMFRILTSGFDQILLILNFGASYWYYLYFTVGVSIELIVYGSHLLRRLEQLDIELRCLKGHQMVDRLTIPAALTRKDSDLERTNYIEIIQASLLDYFNLVAYINPYISLSLLINLFTWFFYTFLFFARNLRLDRLRTFRVIDRGAEMEFLALFVGNLVMLAPLLICSAVLNSKVSQLYRAVATVMARDQSHSVSRQRWSKLLKFFQPRKLHCYTLANYAELSWLFCFKLFWWVISAIVILMSL